MSRRSLLILLTVLLPTAFLAGWLASRGGGPEGSGNRKVLYYVDPMNPSFRSPVPGTAPCGMPLEPVYDEGTVSGAGVAAAGGAVPVSAARLQLIGVTREKVRSRTISTMMKLVGTVAADETRLSTISAATAGRALEMGTATTGSLVTRGQILGTFYAQELIVPQQNYVRLHEAYAALRSTGSNPYDNMQGASQLANYERNLMYARQTLLNLGMSPEQIEEIAAAKEVSYTVQLRAPAAGIVLARRLSLGQSFDVGDELFRIADLESVWILADALEGEERLFSPGVRATVRMPGTGQVFPASVSRVLPQFEASTRTLKVRLDAANPGFLLRPDMFVDVEIPAEIGPAIFLPREAVLDSGTRRAVYVEQEAGVFSPRAVRTGRRLGEFVEIAAGLMAGETVVTSGNFLLDSESRMRTAGAARSVEEPIDPICGMAVEKEKARASGLVSEHGGETWFFCTPGCKQAFDRNPQTVTATASAPPGPVPTTESIGLRTPAVPGTGQAPAPLPSEAATGARHENTGGGMPGAASPAMPTPHSPGHLPPTVDEPAPPSHAMPPSGRMEDASFKRDWALEGQRMPAPVDPVCGMTVDVGRAVAAGLVTRHGAETIHFCSTACKKEFDADPSVFVQSSR